MIWDNNTVSDPSAPSECYGLINRDTMTWYSSGEKLVKALTDTFGLTQTDYTPVYGDGNIRITTSDWWGEKSVTKSQLLAGHKADEIVSITVKCNYRMQIGGIKEIFEYTISKDNIPDQLKIGVTAPSGRTATVWWEIKLAASRLVGDVNGDGNITADDAIIVARLAAGYGDYAERYDSDVADMNRDGKVTADDAIIIARYAAGYPGYADKYTKYV